ncbi:RNA cytidine acetyltransferase [Ctenocephalides felis]|uniref:RNA cytidine acetyltransferase n=1 Tax=Ctenocephalides felis TaxID=7515 RepID=UPI000E6E324A|nr:RNA cytidine acetyltransferase [Ctenocephalides felis]
MVKKKIDNRIRVMIENGVKLEHRTMFVIVGDKGRDQVPILFDILTKSTVKTRPSVLWCYKTKDEAISNHGKKRMKKILSGKIDVNEADLFDTFRVSTTIHGRYYSETHSILGQTYGMCVLQDFEALTPNLLARTIETVEGGGLIIFLLKSIASLKQLYTMSMDVHKRYRTEAHQHVTCRFNERFLLSLADCKRCLLLDDNLTVLPLSSKTAEVKPIDISSITKSEKEEQLIDLKESLRDTPPAGPLINCCKTYDQGKALAQFIESLSEKQLRPPTSLTAARGRGKSAAMGLAIAASVAFGYVNIYVTSPSPENLITLFEFVLKGFDALDYQEHTDYTIIRSTNPEFKKAVVRINITRHNRQTIQYVLPTDSHLLNAADLLVIDEAAAIPLPLVRAMIGPYLIFLSSTINGYEGTGRSLSLKLLQQLAKDSKSPPPIKLDESIRYSPGDEIERWLMGLLCLDVSNVPPIMSGCPPPDSCNLYYIDRDALFCYHKAAEVFLQRLVSIYVASHYKNSPNDLQMMSDAPAHHLFCLLGPVDPAQRSLPEVLVVLQVCLEGQISSNTISQSMQRGKKAAGDLIPWNISEQFNDKEFPKLAGARIVRIATNPNYQRMGYGKRAIQILIEYYEGKIANIDEDFVEETNGIETIDDEQVSLLTETITPRKNVPTLLKKLCERAPEKLDYIGTSFGLTEELLKFWKSKQFVPVYIGQKTNDLTGEHSCIMLKKLDKEDEIPATWLSEYFIDFRRRFIKLLGKAFSEFKVGLGLSILDNKAINIAAVSLTQEFLDTILTPHDISRLENYSRNLVDYRLIVDLTEDLAHLYFYKYIPSDVKLDALQQAIFLGIGLQNKDVDKLSTELGLPGSQILAKFFDAVKKIVKYIMNIMEKKISDALLQPQDTSHMQPLVQSMQEELNEAAKVLEKKQKKQLAQLKKENLEQYKIKGTEQDWKAAIAVGSKGIISVKSGEKRLGEQQTDQDFSHPPKKKSKKKNNKKN